MKEKDEKKMREAVEDLCTEKKGVENGKAFELIRYNTDLVLPIGSMKNPMEERVVIIARGEEMARKYLITLLYNLSPDKKKDIKEAVAKIKLTAVPFSTPKYNFA